MSDEDFEPAKLISMDTTADGTTLTTIEVSSLNSFLYYHPHLVGQITKVRIASSCPPQERKMIIQACSLLQTSHICEPSVDDDGEQPPRSDDHGRGDDDKGDSSSSSHQKSEDGKKA